MQMEYAINEELVSDYTEILIALSFSYERDPTTILLAKEHAPDRKESFYAKIKVRAFFSFEVDGLKNLA